MVDLKTLAEAVISGDKQAAIEITRAALNDGVEAISVLNQGLVAGMDVIGTLFKKNETYIPEVLVACEAMKMAMEVLEPALVKAGVEPVGTFLVGTVQGDLHDIGKNLVGMLLKGAGFKVVDLGRDVPVPKFVEQAKTPSIQLIGLSALLTTTMPAMEKTIKAMRDAGISTKIMVGGAPLDQAWAEKFGADGYAPDAGSAVDKAKELLGIGDSA